VSFNPPEPTLGNPKMLVRFSPSYGLCNFKSSIATALATGKFFADDNDAVFVAMPRIVRYSVHSRERHLFAGSISPGGGRGIVSALCGHGLGPRGSREFASRYALFRGASAGKGPGVGPEGAGDAASCFFFLRSTWQSALPFVGHTFDHVEARLFACVQEGLSSFRGLGVRPPEERGIPREISVQSGVTIYLAARE
jgi:hypothetical protein